MKTIRPRAKTVVSPVFWVPLIQLGVALLCAAVGLLFGIHSALSLLLGGLIAVVGNAVFIWRFFKRVESQSAQDMLKNAYQGAFSKLLLTALLFGLVLGSYDDLEILFLFAGFLVAQAVNWAAPIIYKRQTLG